MALFNTPPPIPTPDGQFPLSPTPTAAGGEWRDAPKIIKGWAYPLTWLGIIVLPLIIIFLFISDNVSIVERISLITLYTVLFCVDVWLNRALKKGTPAAWTVQIVLSIFGLLAFPLGTLIHGYVLSQWFKPETKAWFGLS